MHSLHNTQLQVSSYPQCCWITNTSYDTPEYCMLFACMQQQTWQKTDRKLVVTFALQSSTQIFNQHFLENVSGCLKHMKFFIIIMELVRPLYQLKFPALIPIYLHIHTEQSYLPCITIQRIFYGNDQNVINRNPQETNTA